MSTQITGAGRLGAGRQIVGTSVRRAEHFGEKCEKMARHANWVSVGFQFRSEFNNPNTWGEKIRDRFSTLFLGTQIQISCMIYFGILFDPSLPFFVCLLLGLCRWLLC